MTIPVAPGDAVKAMPDGSMSGTGARPTGFSASERVFLLGEAVYLLMHSPWHQRYSVAQLATSVVTPIKLNQFRLYRAKRGPVGYVAWAYLTDEASADYAADARPLRPQDLDAGTNLWITELVAPFGSARAIVKDLRERIFPNVRARAIRRTGSRNEPRVITCFGARYLDASRRNVTSRN